VARTASLVALAVAAALLAAEAARLVVVACPRTRR